VVPHVPISVLAVRLELLLDEELLLLEELGQTNKLGSKSMALTPSPTLNCVVIV
jgi:hypothetical protein